MICVAAGRVLVGSEQINQIKMAAFALAGLLAFVSIAILTTLLLEWSLK